MLIFCGVKSMVLGEVLESKPGLQEAPRGPKTAKHTHTHTHRHRHRHRHRPRHISALSVVYVFVKEQLKSEEYYAQAASLAYHTRVYSNSHVAGYVVSLCLP